jgi:hypothetical protein
MINSAELIQFPDTLINSIGSTLSITPPPFIIWQRFNADELWLAQHSVTTILASFSATNLPGLPIQPDRR